MLNTMNCVLPVYITQNSSDMQNNNFNLIRIIISYIVDKLYNWICAQTYRVSIITAK